MKVYVGQTRARDLISELTGLGWGEMTQPKEVPARRKPWALDNAAFLAFKANTPWDDAGFMKAVQSSAQRRPLPDFVVVPDIVAGGWVSLEHSERWLPWLRAELQAPCYLAVQDGMTLDGVTPRLAPFDGIFVGGSKGWKLASAFWWTRVAHAVRKPCHVGRISGREHTRLMKAYEVDSIDSCVPLWSKDNREAVLKGLADPPPEFDPPDVEQFLTGWESL